MAKQIANPPPWDDSMSDGCTGVVDRLPFSGDASPDCREHDKAFYYGGGWKDFFRANWNLAKAHWKRGGGWKVLAPIRLVGTSVLGAFLFNWEGPGLPETSLLEGLEPGVADDVMDWDEDQPDP